MLSSSVGKQDYHAATKHSVRSVQLDPNYVDARTQPVAFKAYPHFYRRFPLDRNKPFEQFLALTSAITWQKQYRDCLHSLRVQPAAVILGEAKPKMVRRLRSTLPSVTGTDYFESNRFIEAGYKQTLTSPDLAQSPAAYPAVQFPAPPTAWHKAIEQRRSAQRFYPLPISQTDFATLCTTIQQP